MARRISVRQRLVTVFGISALFAVLASGVGLGVFRVVSDSQRILLEERLPLVKLSQELAQRTQEVAKAAPGLADSQLDSEFISRRDRVEDHLTQVNELLRRMRAETISDPRILDQLDRQETFWDNIETIVGVLSTTIQERIAQDRELRQHRQKVLQSLTILSLAVDGYVSPDSRPWSSYDADPDLILLWIESLRTLLQEMTTAQGYGLTAIETRFDNRFSELYTTLSNTDSLSIRNQLESLRELLRTQETIFSMQRHRLALRADIDQRIRAYGQNASRLTTSTDEVQRLTSAAIQQAGTSLVDTLRITSMLLIGIALFSTVGALGVALIADRTISGRLTAVKLALRKRMGGASMEIPVVGNDEISDLADALNRTIQLSEQREQQLQDSELHLRTLTETLPDAVFGIEPWQSCKTENCSAEMDMLLAKANGEAGVHNPVAWGCIVSANPAAHRLFQVSKARSDDTGTDKRAGGAQPEHPYPLSSPLLHLLTTLEIAPVDTRSSVLGSVSDQSATMPQPSAVDLAFAVLDQASEQDTPITVSGRRRNGSVFRAELTLRHSGTFAGTETRHGGAAQRSDPAAPVLAVLTLRDITARHAAETDRERYLALLGAALEAAEDGLMVSSLEGPVIAYNRRFYEMWGLDAELVVHLPRTQRVNAAAQQTKDPDKFLKNFSELINMPDVVQTGIIPLNDGRLLERFTSPFRLGGQISGRVWSVRDITEREQARRELTTAKEAAETALEDLREAQARQVEAEKLASLGQLVAGVAHEINTPIGITVTAASHIVDETERMSLDIAEGRIRRSRFESFLEMIKASSDLLLSNAHRASELIQSFKQVAVDQASDERRIFNVGDYLHEVLVSLGPRLRKSPHKVAVSCPPDLHVDGFPGVLSQVITNLILNALVHAFPDETPGRIDVTITLLPDDKVELRFKDDGRGMTADERAKAYEPFFTTRRGLGGSGLGLNIVYNLVTGTLGGRIRLVTAPGQGTEFIITMPRVQSRAPQTQTVPHNSISA